MIRYREVVTVLGGAHALCKITTRLWLLDNGGRLHKKVILRIQK